MEDFMGSYMLPSILELNWIPIEGILNAPFRVSLPTITMNFCGYFRNLMILTIYLQKALSQVYHDFRTEEAIIYQRFILPQAIF